MKSERGLWGKIKGIKYEPDAEAYLFTISSSITCALGINGYLHEHIRGTVYASVGSVF